MHALAMEGVGVINMRDAVLGTQVAQDALKALSEETDYAADIEKATLLQTERQALAEKLQKDGETLAQEEIVDIQRDIQEKGHDLFLEYLFEYLLFLLEQEFLHLFVIFQLKLVFRFEEELPFQYQQRNQFLQTKPLRHPEQLEFPKQHLSY